MFVQSDDLSLFIACNLSILNAWVGGYAPIGSFLLHYCAAASVCPLEGDAGGFPKNTNVKPDVRPRPTYPCTRVHRRKRKAAGIADRELRTRAPISLVILPFLITNFCENSSSTSSPAGWVSCGRKSDKIGFYMASSNQQHEHPCLFLPGASFLGHTKAGRTADGYIVANSVWSFGNTCKG
jgi:hypothetical protein